ncbi:unnamed protein product [Polarella glacialis]|uniref:Uncharacterized protein n=1 Tax=Polarella glacialis TaxID=89957 RepID=A0A813FA03_POLGL|nr:unnamed protein product [Polarella glacialis]
MVVDVREDGEVMDCSPDCAKKAQSKSAEYISWLRSAENGALSREFEASADFEEPAGAAESFASGFRAFGCAAVLAVALLAQGANAAESEVDPNKGNEREGIPSGNAKGDPNLSYSSLLPNKGGGSLLGMLSGEGKAADGSPTTFDKVAYGETKEEKKFAEKYAKNNWKKADTDKASK